MGLFAACSLFKNHRSMFCLANTISWLGTKSVPMFFPTGNWHLFRKWVNFGKKKSDWQLTIKVNRRLNQNFWQKDICEPP